MLKGDYTTISIQEKGNLNYKRDYYALQKIDLDETLTMRQAIDRLRALTHPPYQNAFYVDPETGDRIYISVNLNRKQNEG